METALWIVSGLLAAMMLMAGMMKALTPKEKLAEKMGWVNDFSPGAVKLIGLSEILAAPGLILPAYLDVVPVLTPIAAIALMVVMILAGIVHGKRGEMKEVGMNAMLFLMLAFVVWGRLGCEI